MTYLYIPIFEYLSPFFSTLAAWLHSAHDSIYLDVVPFFDVRTVYVCIASDLLNECRELVPVLLLAMSEICWATEARREFLEVLGYSSNILARFILID